VTTPIYLAAKQVPASLRETYPGKKFKACVCERVTIPADEGLWGGGSRDVFTMVRIADGVQVPFPGHDAAPWVSARREQMITLQPGIAVVNHSRFCGSDMGLTFYVHPSDAAPMLPASLATLTDAERHVLASMGFKSSYGGKDRYQLQRDQVNPPWSPTSEHKPFPTRDEWKDTIEALKARGYLNKAGVITSAGRNACSASTQA
jgi:hypothetical protein